VRRQGLEVGLHRLRALRRKFHLKRRKIRLRRPLRRRERVAPPKTHRLR
jgi:hypothetical protein